MDNMITFEQYGRTFTMALGDIDAIYRYQKHQYSIEDGEMMLRVYALGWDESEADMDDPKYRAFFEGAMGCTWEEAISKLDEIIEFVEDHFDWDAAPISIWREAIIEVLGNRNPDIDLEEFD